VAGRVVMTGRQDEVGVNGCAYADSLSRMLRLSPLVGGLLSIFTMTAAVRADQVVVTDVTYTHSAETTSDSHYHVTPLAGTPSNWNSPVDYIKGSVHVLLEVKTKPAGDTPTKFQICFEGTPSYACTEQSPTYTKPGKYEWNSAFSSPGFYFGGQVDWSKGVNQIALILKDTMNNKPAGDPKYMPTDLHVEVSLLSQGASYVAPPAAGSGAGAPPVDANAGRAGGAGSGGVPSKVGAGGVPAPRAGRPGVAGRDAASSGGAGGATASLPLPPTGAGTGAGALAGASGVTGVAGMGAGAGINHEAAGSAGHSHPAGASASAAGEESAGSAAGESSKHADSGCGVARVRSAAASGWSLCGIGTAALARLRRRRELRARG